MSIKKYSSGQWVDTPYRKYESATDTITTLPKTIITDGQSASAVIKGNLSQSGTPTPTTPIYPQETGDKTANWFDKNSFTFGTDTTIVYVPIYVGEGDFTLSTDFPENSTRDVFFMAGAVSSGASSSGNGVSVTAPRIRTAVNGYVTVATRYNSLRENPANYNYMLNSGSEALPYQPYGYKIPILSGNTTTPIYLSEPIRKISAYVDTVASSGMVSRAIKKLVLTGEESWNIGSTNVGYRFSFYLNNSMQSDTTVGKKSYCSHYTLTSTGNTYNVNDVYTITASHDLMISSSIYTTLTTWKQYLADQYAAGTPVTVWYVLETPTTETITALSIPTTGTAESFDVDTTLKPSEVSLTYHGWHEHNDTKYTT